MPPATDSARATEILTHTQVANDVHGTVDVDTAVDFHAIGFDGGGVVASPNIPDGNACALCECSHRVTPLL